MHWDKDNAHGCALEGLREEIGALFLQNNQSLSQNVFCLDPSLRHDDDDFVVKDQPLSQNPEPLICIYTKSSS